MISRRQIIEQKHRQVMSQSKINKSSGGGNYNSRRDEDELDKPRRKPAPSESESSNTNKTSNRQELRKHRQVSSSISGRLEQNGEQQQLPAGQRHFNISKRQEDSYLSRGRQFGGPKMAELAHDDSYLAAGYQEERRRMEQESNQSEGYRHFDPYSIYGCKDEDEDVWYSEEGLFEVSSRVAWK